MEHTVPMFELLAKTYMFNITVWSTHLQATSTEREDVNSTELEINYSNMNPRVAKAPDRNIHRGRVMDIDQYVKSNKSNQNSPRSGLLSNLSAICYKPAVQLRTTDGAASLNNRLKECDAE